MARWSVTVKKMALQWARCMGLPDGAIVEVRLRKNRAEVVVESEKQLQNDLPPDSISSSQSLVAHHVPVVVKGIVDRLLAWLPGGEA